MGKTACRLGHLRLAPWRAQFRAAIYARISQDRSGGQAGVTRQLEDTRKLAAERGWEVVEEFAGLVDLKARSLGATGSRVR